MKRTCLKLCGESGTGLLSMQDMVSRALKSMGYYVHADREYPSLIKGGASNSMIQFDDDPVWALSTRVDLMMAMDYPGLVKFWEEAPEGTYVVHAFERHEKTDLHQRAAEKGVKMVYVPARKIAYENGGNELMVNMVMLGFMWGMLGFDLAPIEEEVRRKFAKKPKLLAIDLKCLQAGYDLQQEHEAESFLIEAPREKAPEDWIMIDGNHALALGAIQCGVRAYYAYPMSPSSSILTHMANHAKFSGAVVKQAEDEITAVQMAIGSMHMGTRALTATSGGGFDLMTETVSLAGIIETPLVIVIAQRPGPGTGLPTWTSQGDLNLAMYAGHGEYTRLVLAVSDSSSAYELIQHAMNYAEEFQIPVIVLTEKVIAESKWMVPAFEHGAIPIKRGLVTDEARLKELVPEDRYRITENGISERWIPGAAPAHYYANSDEHKESGVLTEDGDEAEAMISKRLRKMDTLLEALPEPRVFGPATGADFSFMGWGSTLNVMKDAMALLEKEGVTVNYLHFDYLFPLKTERLLEFVEANENVCLIEGNATGQLGELIHQKTNLELHNRLLKFNGRPFFVEDILTFVRDAR